MENGLTWAEIRSCSVAVPEDVVFRDMVEETVLLNLATGRYHGIDEIGARFFALMRDSNTLGDAAAALAREFEQEEAVMEHDLQAFAAQMLGFGLVTLRPARSKSP